MNPVPLGGPMARLLPSKQRMVAWTRQAFPVTSLLILMIIGVVDLVATAWLHAHGLIVELNPLMRPLIEHSEWLFAGVKAATLVVAYVVMLRYTQVNRAFVARACTYASLAYVGIWLVWFTSSH